MVYCAECYRHGQDLITCCGKQRCPACDQAHQREKHSTSQADTARRPKPERKDKT
jgi:ribosomal protein L44E